MIDRRGTGPFKVEKETAHLGGMMAIGGEEPELVEVVEISDAEGNPFAYVLPEDCSGKDLQAAKARAQRIAESLNKTDPLRVKTAEFGQPCRAPEPGKCRICGRKGMHWVDETKTLCDLPDCVKAARAELTTDPDQAETLHRPFDGKRYGFAPRGRR